MELVNSPVLWIVLALSIAIPAVFILGTRQLAYRLSGRQSTTRTTKAWYGPTLHIKSLAQVLRALAVLAVLGVAVGIVVMRFVYGIGAVTNLSDQFPWGLWIGFDVMSGVALAAGAFVMTATVHIFRIKRFEPLVRPALLTGLLGYLLVVAGLIVDLGRPYNVWRPLAHWQPQSVLWEVGVCVATYTTVLLIEFSPSILERLNRFPAITNRLPTLRLYQILRRVSIGFVILGVVLSTLHQSSLGSLYVLLPEKLDALWYSLYLPFFFWLSAIAIGLSMVIVESTLSSRVFKRGLEIGLLGQMARVAAGVLSVYLVARGADLISREAWPAAFQLTPQAIAFWAEIGLGVIAPILLFGLRSPRGRPATLFGGAMLMVLFGGVLYRLNVSIVGMWSYTGIIYLPSWMEVAVSAALVLCGVLVFGLAAKCFPVFRSENEEIAH